MYLLILEDMTLLVSDDLSDEDKMSCDAGILDAIYVGDIEPTQYHDGELHPIKKI
jgi:hypothetical protein